LQQGTLVPMNIEVLTKYHLSQDRIVVFFKYVSTAKARCPTDQRSMATETLSVSLEDRSKTNSPRQRFYSQLFCKIVRYFYRTLYNVRFYCNVFSHILSLKGKKVKFTPCTGTVALYRPYDL
jgi:hypothetical protein